MIPKKTIFTYNDYRAFLRDAYMLMKEENKYFSFRYFSKVAGFKSPSVLKQVMDGEIDLARKSIDKFAKAFKLNKEETTFFRHLVLFNQAKTADEKQTHLEAMLRSRSFKKLYPLSSLQLNYFRHWYFIAVREMVALSGFREDPEWIAKTVNPKITPIEAKKALDELLQLGLLVRGPEGKLEQADINVSSGNEAVSQALVSYHRAMMSRASESMDRYARELRDISAITVGIPSSSIKSLKEMVQKFRKELLEAATVKSEPSDVVYQVNFQIFPLTDKIGGDAK
jgi:uncharacterized protein (TIGR02147 family)